MVNSRRKAGSGMVRIDFHTHTQFSWDCRLRLEYLRRRYEGQGIVPLITDHNVFEGARRLSKMMPCFLGMEINTKEGEIIACFLKKPIKPYLSLEQTLDEIHRQGALSIVPHPFDRLRRKRIHLDRVSSRVLSKIDIIEVFNSRTLFRSDNQLAVDFAKRHGKPVVVGSDSHTFLEIGRSYVEMKPFRNNAEFLRNLRSAKLVRKKSPFIVHAYTKARKILKGIP